MASTSWYCTITFIIVTTFLIYSVHWVSNGSAQRRIKSASLNPCQGTPDPHQKIILRERISSLLHRPVIGQKWLFLQGGNGLPTGLGIPAIIHWPSVQLQAKAEGREETVWQVKSPHYGLFSPFALKVEQSRKPENTCLAGNLHKMYPGARSDTVTENPEKDKPQLSPAEPSQCRGNLNSYQISRHPPNSINSLSNFTDGEGRNLQTDTGMDAPL